jgi:hypothetical protein
MHESVQAVSQQMLSGEQTVPAKHPPATIEQSCPCLLLHAPWLSQVPAHLVRSSWFFTATQAPAEQAWHTPLQSLRCTHSTHWLAVVSHTFAAALTMPPSAPPSAASSESASAPASGLPAQCLFCVHATHRPLAAQAGVPGRARQSLSPEHFAHRLPKHRGALAESVSEKLTFRGGER